MITAQEEKLTELENLCEAASEELEKTAELMDKVSRLYDELISYADLYDSANFEAKKMIVSQLIKAVYVYRDYRLEVEFRVSFDDFRRLCVGCEPNGGRIATVESV